ALEALDLPTVVFPLQYIPLCEGGRIGAVTYRAWMVASGEVKPRPGEQKHPSAAITEAIAGASLAALVTTRTHLAMLKTSLGGMREVFTRQGRSVGLQNLTALVVKMQGLVDPRSVHDEAAASMAQADDARAAAQGSGAAAVAVGAPTSLAE